MSYNLGILLAPYRRRAAQTDLATVVGDPEAIRVLAAWPNVDSRWSAPERQMPEGDCSTERWRWLWEEFLYNRAALAQFASLGEARTKQLVITCAMSRILYPDGSVSKPAQALLAELVRHRSPVKIAVDLSGYKNGTAPNKSQEQQA